MIHASPTKALRSYGTVDPRDLWRRDSVIQGCQDRLYEFGPVDKPGVIGFWWGRLGQIPNGRWEQPCGGGVHEGLRLGVGCLLGFEQMWRMGVAYGSVRLSDRATHLLASEDWPCKNAVRREIKLWMYLTQFSWWGPLFRG